MYSINSITNEPTIKVDKGEILVDRVRNTINLSMQESGYNGYQASRTILLKKCKRGYRGDVVDTQLFLGEGSIANFRFRK